MPVYLAPGVYVEEVPGTPPIVGVGTSTAGLIGQVADDVVMAFKAGSTTTRYAVAPQKTPVLVTNFEQFKTNFGDFQQKNQILAHAIWGFFLNGGTRAWIARVADITDATQVGAALTAFEKIDDIAIVAAPGALSKDVQTAVTQHCEKLQSRFAIVDGQRTTTLDVANIGGGLAESNYAALYFPWIQVVDQTQDSNGKTVAGARLFVPPAGHMAGLYSRVDETRGVHKAPANEQVRGALDLEYLVSTNEQKGLNPKGVNVIRGFDGALKVWGARTFGGDDNGEFKYINVRRLMIFLRESIDRGTQFVVFEPNAKPLWQKIIRALTAFLTTVWRDGALFGDTPEQAFYVKCDERRTRPRCATWAR